MRNPGEELRAYYSDLLRRLGRQGWWPARTRLEVILGAILTQNTSWRNATLALRDLRRAGLLNFERLRRAREAEIAAAIRSAGFFRQKAAAIRAFLDWLEREYGGSLPRMFAAPDTGLREQLLRLRGLGPETVDCILLYAGRRPSFVADAYTRRVLARHGWLRENAGYREAQEFFHRHLPRDAALYNEFHALLVETGKRWCRKRAADCAACPLGPHLERAEATQSGWTQPLAESRPA